MKKFKVLFVIIVLITLVTSGFKPIFAIDIPSPNDSIYVQDFADVLSDETSNYIISQNDKLYEVTGAQIVVVTISDTQGYDIEDYAYEMFNDYKIGSATKNNGVLLLLVINDDNYWIMVGKGLETTLTGGVLKGLLLDYLEDDFALQQYDSGTRKFFDAIYRELEYIYQVDNLDNQDFFTPIPPIDDQNTYYSLFTNIINTVIAFIIMLVIVIVILSILSALAKRRRYSNDNHFITPTPRRPISPFNSYQRNTTSRPKTSTTKQNSSNYYAPSKPTVRQSPSVTSPRKIAGKSRSFTSRGGSFGSFGGSRSFGGGGSRGGGAGRK